MRIRRFPRFIEKKREAREFTFFLSSPLAGPPLLVLLPLLLLLLHLSITILHSPGRIYRRFASFLFPSLRSLRENGPPAILISPNYSIEFTLVNSRSLRCSETFRDTDKYLKLSLYSFTLSVQILQGFTDSSMFLFRFFFFFHFPAGLSFNLCCPLGGSRWRFDGARKFEEPVCGSVGEPRRGRSHLR